MERGPVGPSLRLRGRIRRLGTPLLLLAPALAILIGLRLVPIGDAIRLSFTDWDGFGSPQWIGFDNFEALLDDQRFKGALVNTLQILLALPVWILVPYLVAWGLHNRVFGWRLFRFAFFVPIVLSPAVIGVYYGIVLQPEGPFNSMLRAVGLGGLARAWLNDPSLAMPVVITIIVWSTFGVGVLIFLSGLSNLDHEQVDAARVDGANAWQIQRHVIFWQLLPVIEFWAVIIMIASFTGFFPLIYSLTGGGPGFSTYTVDFHMYQEAFGNGHLGYASSIGAALLVLMAIIGAIQLRIMRGRRA